ncbi:MAG: peptidoglycan DD-metalloendopeptidase family protein [Bacteroidales bacterium]|jgi:murein DD-endopeptidase MepM/ murein hydrolase activator NlpD|nr:peptidoglycan DD-metalloendopeptidase family protein [Bacteroidales bacterium]
MKKITTYKILCLLLFSIISININSQNKKQVPIDTVNNGKYNIILYNDFSWKYENHDSILKIFDIEDSVKLYTYIRETKFLSCDNEWFEKNWDTTIMWSYEEKNYKIYEDTLLINLLCSGNFIVPHKGKVSSKFGWRSGRLHQGTDIQLHTGDTIVAAFDGKVRFVGSYYGYGNVIVIRCHNGLETVYAHLSKIDCFKNQEVKAGDYIGKGGSTGRSTGPHLHFEIRYKNTPIDPQLIVDFEKGDLISSTFLIIPKHFSYAKEVNESQYYIVKSGDTLGGIASRYRTNIKSICRMNNISETTILSIGKQLRVH